jgi:hypothetical protein
VAIDLTCPCGRKLRIQDRFAGQTGQCPACGRELRIPNPQEEAWTSPPEGVDHLDVVPQEEVPEVEEAEAPVTDHGGAELTDEEDFFVGPPKEIGTVITADSTLNQHDEPWTTGGRLACVGISVFFAVLLGALIVTVFDVETPLVILFWPGVLALVAGGIALYVTGFSHTCTYVGRDGVARFVCSGRRDNLTTDEVFLFRDAVELRTSQTLHYLNGSYQNTSYTFTWSDISGRTRHVIQGSHNSEAGTPPSSDLYHFARSAELAWTVYMLDDAYRKMQTGTPIRFNLTKGRSIRIGDGFVVFNLDGEDVRWRADDIAAITVQQGVVCIRRHDAKEGWFSSSGVVKFKYDELGNAQLFFHAAEKLLRIAIE